MNLFNNIKTITQDLGKNTLYKSARAINTLSNQKFVNGNLKNSLKDLSINIGNSGRNKYAATATGALIPLAGIGAVGLGLSTGSKIVGAGYDAVSNINKNKNYSYMNG